MLVPIFESWVAILCCLVSTRAPCVRVLAAMLLCAKVQRRLHVSWQYAHCADWPWNVLQSMCKLVTVGYHAGDIYLHLAPLFHIGGISSALAVLLSGGSHVFLPR